MAFQIVKANGEFEVLLGIILPEASDVKLLCEFSSGDEIDINLIKENCYLIYPSQLRQVCVQKDLNLDDCPEIRRQLEKNDSCAIGISKRLCRAIPQDL